MRAETKWAVFPFQSRTSFFFFYLQSNFKFHMKDIDLLTQIIIENAGMKFFLFGGRHTSGRGRESRVVISILIIHDVHLLACWCCRWSLCEAS